ncbi:MAG: hypothetical protein AAGJ35_07305 [Myxococcota bacterium]
MSDVIRGAILGAPVEIDRAKALRTPARVLRFLSGINANPSAAKMMEEFGYSEEIHEQGWKLMDVFGGRKLKFKWAKEPALSFQDCVAKLDAFDEQAFQRTKGALYYAYRDQYDYIFENLKAARGIESIQTVHTFLKRTDALANGSDPQRSNSREKDKAAVELLAKRKILTPEIREELETWLKGAKAMPNTETFPDAAARRKAREQALVELVAWFDEWSVVARNAVTVKKYRISMGISQRAESPKDTPEEDTGMGINMEG